MTPEVWVAFFSLAFTVLVTVLSGAMFIVAKINGVRELGRRELDAAIADQNMQRHDTRDRLSSALSETEERLSAQIRAAADKAGRDHDGLTRQVADIAGSVRDHYIRRADFEGGMTAIAAALAVLQKEVGDLRNNLIDNLRKN